MAYIPVPDVAMVELRGNLFSQNIENTLYFEYSGPPSTTALEELGDAVAAWWIAEVVANLSSDYSYREAYVTDLSASTAPTYVALELTPVAGGNSSPSLPGNVAACISFRTPIRGRSGRGRNYLSGLGENAVTGNQFGSSTASALTFAYNLLVDGIEDMPGWTWVVVSRYTAGAPRALGVAYPITTAAFTDLNIDSQRRRLTGRGN